MSHCVAGLKKIKNNNVILLFKIELEKEESKCSKDNQTMKCGQLTEYNRRNIFHEIPYIKCDYPGSFSKNSKLCISLDQ